MFKRLFFAMLGLGAGVALGVAVTRKVGKTQKAMRPDNVAANVAARAGGLRGRLAIAVQEGRRASADKEAELLGVYRASRAPVER